MALQKVRWSLNWSALQVTKATCINGVNQLPWCNHQLVSPNGVFVCSFFAACQFSRDSMNELFPMNDCNKGLQEFEMELLTGQERKEHQK